MISYNLYKRSYTTGGEFLLNGEDYTGYIEIIDSIPCTYPNKEILTPNQTFGTDLKTSKYFLDRLFNDDLNLPYSISDIHVEHNDILSYNLFKDKLSKLHENNTFLYSRMFIPDSNIPTTSDISYVCCQTNNNTQLSYLTGFVNVVPFKNTANFSVLGNIKNMSIIRHKDISDIYVMFGITDTQFVSLTSNKYETNIIEVSDKFETIENSLSFKKLTDISCNDTYAFITDTDNNCVIKYRIDGYLVSDKALANKRNYIKAIGGTGKPNDQTRFNKPTYITANKKDVVVYDSGNKVIKIFDEFFNYKKTLSNINLNSEKIVELKINPITNNTYVLTQLQDLSLKLYVFDSDYQLRNTDFLKEELDTDEQVADISFSHNDSNIWYIATNKSIYKKLINRPDAVVGKMQPSKMYKNSNAVSLNTTWTEQEITQKTIIYTLTGLSAATRTTTVSSISAVYNSANMPTLTATTVTVTLSSTTTIPITAMLEPIQYVQNIIYNTSISSDAPVSNYWNNTNIRFNEANIKWNSIDTQITQSTDSIIITAPYRYYRFVMYEDASLTKVLGYGASWNGTRNGLINIKMDVAQLPGYRPWTGISNYANASTTGNNSLSTSIQTITNPSFKVSPLNFVYSSAQFYLPFAHPAKTTLGYNEEQYFDAPLGVFSINYISDIANAFNINNANYVDYKIRYSEYINYINRNPGSNIQLPDVRVYSFPVWSPYVKDEISAEYNSYLEIDMSTGVSLSGIRILAGNFSYWRENTDNPYSTPLSPYSTIQPKRLITPPFIGVLGSNNKTTYYLVASASMPPSNQLTQVPITPGVFIPCDIFPVASKGIADIRNVSKNITTTTTTSQVLSNTIVYTPYGYNYDIIIYEDVEEQYDEIYYYDVTTLGYEVKTIEKTITSDSVVDDIFASCNIVESDSNTDDIIILTNNRIYFVYEPSSYASIIKYDNFVNYGSNAFSLQREEYIQTSTINKELYKVLYDLYTLRNNIVGRFNGRLDNKTYILDDAGYNYNIPLFMPDEIFTTDFYESEQNLENLFVNENEKNITAVINRVLSQIYNIQRDIFLLTQTDTSTDLKPVFNAKDTLILN